MERPPKYYIIQIDDSKLSQFISYWIDYQKPCSLLFQSPNTEGLTAIKLIVNSTESADFVLATKNNLGIKLYDITNKYISQPKKE